MLEWVFSKRFSVALVMTVAFFGAESSLWATDGNYGQKQQGSQSGSSQDGSQTKKQQNSQSSSDSNASQTQGQQQSGKWGQSSSGSTQQQPSSGIQWYTNYDSAVAKAKQANKPLLLFFTGSDWCGWCKKMDSEVFDNADFIKDAGSSYVFVEVDFPMNKQLPADQQQQNALLKQKYGVTGYPTIVLLDASGNFIAETGYRPGGGKAYAAYLKELVQGSSS